MNSNKSLLSLAGVAVAIGAFGVVLASIFYALSPVDAALPSPDFSIDLVREGMIKGQVTMRLAGIVGVVSDVILIAGSLLLMLLDSPGKLQMERFGWALTATGVFIFVIVDSLSAGVLTQLSVLDDAVPVFAGFKLMFNIFFVVGTITVGLGSSALLLGDMNGSKLLPRPLAWLGVLFSWVGLIASILYFVDIAMPQVIGISIAVISLVFGIFGIRIARSGGK